MVEQHSQDHERDGRAEVHPTTLQKLDWWITGSHPLAELNDLAVPEHLVKSGEPAGFKTAASGHRLCYSTDSQELNQHTWACHEEWKHRRLRELESGISHVGLQKLNVLVQLSTIGICMRMKYDLGGQEVALDYSHSGGAPGKPERFRLSGEHDPGDDWAAVDLPLPSSARPKEAFANETSYEVKMADCIDEGLSLQKKGLNPVLLNVANGERPGGGYRTGEDAPEEDIFRRTDYCFSVDEDLQVSLQYQGVKSRKSLYPHGTFGAVYSQQVVFRHGAEQGYKLMPHTAVLPFIAMAVRRRGGVLRWQPLTLQERQELFKKFVLVCEVSLHQGHTELVVGPWDRGTAGLPPREAAMVFRAALSCFHGCFRRVVFVTRGAEASDALASAFDRGGRALLASARGGAPALSLPAAAAGPCRLCPAAWAHAHGNGGSAAGWREAGCPWQLRGGDEAALHSSLFWHPPKCEAWGDCEEIEDREHQREYEHPQICAAGAGCHDFSRSHETSRLHPTSWRRSRPRLCPLQSRCPDFLDRRHCGQCLHPFREPCPRGHLCRADPAAEPEHWARFAHVCREGARCPLLQAQDPEHLSAYVHPDLSLLPGREGGGRQGDGARCGASSSSAASGHRLSFAHAGEADYLLWRKPCPRRCCQEGGDHNFRFYHRVENIPRCPYKGINSDANFAENHKYLLGNIAAAGLDLQESQIAEVEAWISRLRPTHRCKVNTFQSMLRLGAMVSTGIIDDIHQQNNDVVLRIAQDVAEHNPICQRECQKHEGKDLEQLKKYIRKVVAAQYHIKAGMQASVDVLLEELQMAKASLADSGVDEASVLAVRQAAEQVANACHDIKAMDYIGIGYSVDRHLCSHRNIFALLGPHTGQYYGHICLVLKRDLLFHADSHLLANSATALNSGEAHNNRPWCPANPKAPARDQECQHCMNMGFDCCEFKDENRKVFERSKVHPCIHQWQRLLALEMLGQAKNLNYEASLKGVQKMWYDQDSHAVIEAHLPSLIHLGYVEKIVMTKEQRGNLTEQDVELLRSLFPERVPLELRELPRDDRHIFKPAYDQTKDLAEAPSPELDRTGLCITLPPCGFDNRRIFPLPLALHPSEALPTQHLTLRVNKDASFCLVLAASARHLRDHRSAKEAEFVTVLLAAAGGASSDSRSSLFMGGCLPKVPDVVFDPEREREYRARGMCYVPGFDDAACETDGYRSYYLRVDASGQVLFGHYGADTLLNRKAGLYPDPPMAVSSPLRHQVHVGLLTLHKPVSFADVVVWASPPPAVLPPQGLAELARTPEALPHLHVPLDDGGAPGDQEALAGPSPPALGLSSPRSFASPRPPLGQCEPGSPQRGQRRPSLLSWQSRPFRSPPRGPEEPAAGPRAEEPGAPPPRQPRSPDDLGVAQGGPAGWPPAGAEAGEASSAVSRTTSVAAGEQSDKGPSDASPVVYEFEDPVDDAALDDHAAEGPDAEPRSPSPGMLHLCEEEAVEPPQASALAPSSGRQGVHFDFHPAPPKSGAAQSGPAHGQPGGQRWTPPAPAGAAPAPAPPGPAAERAPPLEAISAAPDPAHSELLIHKEALPQVVMVAPDPATSELAMHRQVLPQAILASPSMRRPSLKMSL